MEVLTIETTEQEQQVYNDKVTIIKEALTELSPPLIDSLHEYVTFLLEKEKKHRAFVQRVLDAKKEPTIICNNIKVIHLIDIGTYEEVY